MRFDSVKITRAASKCPKRRSTLPHWTANSRSIRRTHVCRGINRTTPDRSRLTKGCLPMRGRYDFVEILLWRSFATKIRIQELIDAGEHSLKYFDPVERSEEVNWTKHGAKSGSWRRLSCNARRATMTKLFEFPASDSCRQRNTIEWRPRIRWRAHDLRSECRQDLNLARRPDFALRRAVWPSASIRLT